VKVKENQTTVLANQYMKTTHALTADINNKMMGFGAGGNDDDEGSRPSTRGRGGKRGGGDRGGRDSITNVGAKRQNARKAL